jgi:hypothetical protein
MGYEICDHTHVDAMARMAFPGRDPYYVREVTTDEDRRTSFRGEMNQ